MCIRDRRFLEQQDLAADVDGDLLRQVPAGDGGGDLGDVADLRREIAGHLIDGFGEVLPHAGHAADLRLSSELAFRADLARDARDFGGEAVELVDHRVDGVLQLKDLAADVDGDLLRQVAAGHGDRHLDDVAHLGGCLLYTSPSPRDRTRSRMPSSA